MDDHYNLYYIFLWDFERTVVPQQLAEQIQNTLQETFYEINLNIPPIDDS